MVLCPMLTLLFPDGLIHFFAASLMYYSISLLLSLSATRTQYSLSCCCILFSSLWLWESGRIIHGPASFRDWDNNAAFRASSSFELKFWIFLFFSWEISKGSILSWREIGGGNRKEKLLIYSFSVLIKGSRCFPVSVLSYFRYPSTLCRYSFYLIEHNALLWLFNLLFSAYSNISQDAMLI